MIDIHAHVLPGLDDGPATLSEAVALVRAAVRNGVETIVATPHVDRRWRVRPQAIAPACAALRDALATEGVDIEILAGAEIALDRLVDLRPEELAGLALGGAGTLLIEAPLETTPGDFTWPIRRLLGQGWGVVLAHPERSPAFQREPELLARLASDGAGAQITAGALAGRFGGTARRTALAFLRNGLADVIATDAHDLSRRPPELAEGLEALREEAPAVAGRWDALTRLAPRAILGRDALPAHRPAAA